MSPTVQYAEQRWERRGVSYEFSDGLVLDLEAEYGFQVNPMTGKSQADEKLVEARDRAWRRMARAHIQMRNAERIPERNATSKAEFVAQADIEAEETELQQTDHVTPLGERPSMHPSYRIGQRARSRIHEESPHRVHKG